VNIGVKPLLYVCLSASEHDGGVKKWKWYCDKTAVWMLFGCWLEWRSYAWWGQWQIYWKAELSSVGGSELSKTGGASEDQTPFKYMGWTWWKCTRPLRVLAVQCQLLLVNPITQPRNDTSTDGKCKKFGGWLCRSKWCIVAKWLSRCRWDAGWSEGVMNAEESGEFMEKSWTVMRRKIRVQDGEWLKVNLLSILTERCENVLARDVC